MTAAALASTIATVLMSLVPLRQVALICETRSSANLSLFTAASMWALIGVLLWYGITINSLPLIVGEIIGSITNGLLVAGIILFREHRQTACEIEHPAGHERIAFEGVGR